MCHDALARCRLVEHRAAEEGARRGRVAVERQREEPRDGKRGKYRTRWRKSKALRLVMVRVYELDS